MPSFRRLSDTEVADLTRRRADLSELTEYLDYLKKLKPGDWGSVELAPDETQRTVKRRMSIAAASLAKKVRWRAGRRDGEPIVFQILPDE